MWVYQEQPASKASEAGISRDANKTLAEAETPDAAAVEKTETRPAVAKGSAVPIRTEAARHYRGQAARGSILLAAAYLLGTAAAGMLCAMCDAGEQEVLDYYLRCWCALFNLGEGQSPAILFSTEYSAMAGMMTLLLLFGLSALGPVPIFLLTMLYGAGCGLLASQLFEGITPKVFAAYILVAGVPIAAAAGCVCVFGASAISVCSRLRAFSFSAGKAVPAGSGAAGLIGKYLFFIAALAPVCGAATGLVYMANQAHLW